MRGICDICGGLRITESGPSGEGESTRAAPTANLGPQKTRRATPKSEWRDCTRARALGGDALLVPVRCVCSRAIIIIATTAEAGAPDVAQGLYERLLNEFPGSLYAVEARKRFRRLRGDILE